MVPSRARFGAGKDGIDMSEEQQEARRALQESMDLRDQGHA